MKTKTVFFLIATLALLPASLRAQSAQAHSEAEAAAAAQASTPQARIDAALAAAARADVPVSLLERKVAEGRAKRVPEARIATAVETRLQALVRANETMRRAEAKAVSAGELSVAADALQAGVGESALIRITRDAPKERRAVATAVLTDLVRLGYKSEPAYTRVHAALSSGPEALVNLRAEAAASLRVRGQLSTEIDGGIIR